MNDKRPVTMEALREGLSVNGTKCAFLGVGHGLKAVDGKLTVSAVDDFQGDNTLPMTAAGIDTLVGNIQALLETI